MAPAQMMAVMTLETALRRSIFWTSLKPLASCRSMSGSFFIFTFS